MALAPTALTVTVKCLATFHTAVLLCSCYCLSRFFTRLYTGSSNPNTTPFPVELTIASITTWIGLSGRTTTSLLYLIDRVDREGIESSSTSSLLVFFATLILPPALETLIALSRKHDHRQWLFKSDVLDPHTIFTKDCHGCRATAITLFFVHFALCLCADLGMVWTDNSIFSKAMGIFFGLSVLWFCVAVWQHLTSGAGMKFADPSTPPTWPTSASSEAEEELIIDTLDLEDGELTEKNGPIECQKGTCGCSVRES